MTDIPPPPSKTPLLVIIGFAVAGAVLAAITYFIAHDQPAAPAGLRQHEYRATDCESDDQACTKQVTVEGLQSWRDRSTPPRGRRTASAIQDHSMINCAGNQHATLHAIS